MASINGRVRKGECATLDDEERDLLDYARRTGDLDTLAEYYFRLPMGGSRWWPDESIGHYRSLFTYGFLLNTWDSLNRPDKFVLQAQGLDLEIRVIQEDEL